jgi:hypothetical protein
MFQIKLILKINLTHYHTNNITNNSFFLIIILFHVSSKSNETINLIRISSFFDCFVKFIFFPSILSISLSISLFHLLLIHWFKINKISWNIFLLLFGDYSLFVFKIYSLFFFLFYLLAMLQVLHYYRNTCTYR